MKVLLVNGSPNAQGCTFTALSEVAETLNKEGIETHIFQLGKKPISGCIACFKCQQKPGRCAINDIVNDFVEMARETDGFVFGSPVYFSSATGSITSFMDRAFFCPERSMFHLKPAAAVVSARRAGTTATFDQLNKYFTICQMPIIASSYWNMVHGFTPEDVRQDLEGLQIMRNLGRNMAWFLRCKEAGIAAGVPFPEKEEQILTNFHGIRHPGS
ncbi:NADPH-dependent FMN reductase [uncultured delta proteobacterium]|uniref:NADPH-dependent FMN reductase n=1 Tax=uncultured delta proteobacterium TaxID=34034 RepID=A0A212J1I5_9DELT|nr:NADPH-dependent FMN reductase [uncultured delta proteobacterium]